MVDYFNGEFISAMSNYRDSVYTGGLEFGSKAPTTTHFLFDTTS